VHFPNQTPYNHIQHTNQALCLMLYLPRIASRRSNFHDLVTHHT